MFRMLLLVVAGWVSCAAQAAVVFQDLSTAAPPATLGGFPMSPFSLAAQAAVPDGTLLTSIPGSPVGSLTTNASVRKATVPTTWNGWSHGFTGPVYNTPGLATPAVRVLTLPSATKAFYFYANQNAFLTSQTITATTDTGTTSGPITIQALIGTANGYGFFSTAGENIVSITITTSDATGFGFGEFGINVTPLVVPALSSGALGLLVLLISMSGLLLALRRR